MTIWGRARDSRSPATSSEAADRDVIEVVAQGGSLPRLDQRFRRAAIEGRDRLRPIPSERLPVAAGPIGHATDDLQHVAHARLRLRSANPACLVKRFALEPDGFGKLDLR